MRTFAQKQKPIQQGRTVSSSTNSLARSSQSLAVRSILHLQRTIGNQSVQRLLKSNPEELNAASAMTVSPRFVHDFSQIPILSPSPVQVQPKLMVNTPGDIYEQEADRVAEHVMRMPDSTVQGQTEEEKSIQTKPLTNKPASVATGLQSRLQPLKDGGQPLPESERTFFEPRLVADFSHVRIHNDPTAANMARAINARAFAMERDVVFGNGEYAPGTASGRRLLAHELTHVVQQGRYGLNTVQRFTYGGDGPFNSTQKAKIDKAYKIALALVSSHSFKKQYKALQLSFKRAPKFPSYKKYLQALNSVAVNNLDKSKDPVAVKFLKNEVGMPLESQTAGITIMATKKVCLREFAVNQGIDTIVHLLIHESFHVAGLGMGPFLIYEPFLHGFETKSGFPMNLGGADIISIKHKRIGDYHEDITFTYKLRKVPYRPLPKNIEIKIVYVNDGSLVYDEKPDGTRVPAKKKIPSIRGTGKWTWHAKYKGFVNDYSVRIIETNGGQLLASKHFKGDAKCLLGVSSRHCQ